MKACGKSWTTIQRATILHRKSTVTKLPEFLTDYSFVLIQVEMEKNFVWALFGHLLFIHLVLTWTSARCREGNKDRLVCVCFTPDSRPELRWQRTGGWTFPASLYLLRFALFSRSVSFQVMWTGTLPLPPPSPPAQLTQTGQAAGYERSVTACFSGEMSWFHSLIFASL